MDAIFDFVGAVAEVVTNAAKVTFAALGIFILMAVISLATAFVARDCWNWFVAPLGLPRIGLAHAYGLIVLVGLFRGLGSNEQRQDETDSIGEAIAKPLVGLTLTWGLGWLIVTLAGPF